MGTTIIGENLCLRPRGKLPLSTSVKTPVSYSLWYIDVEKGRTGRVRGYWHISKDSERSYLAIELPLVLTCIRILFRIFVTLFMSLIVFPLLTCRITRRMLFYIRGIFGYPTTQVPFLLNWTGLGYYYILKAKLYLCLRQSYVLYWNKEWIQTWHYSNPYLSGPLARFLI